MMETQEKLIAALLAAHPDKSQAAVARLAGLEPPRFNNYVTGIRTMDVDAVIGCAQALGWDVRRTVSAHLQETAPTPRVKALWKQLAGGAALVLCAIGLSGAVTGKAYATNVSPLEPGSQSGSMPIMSRRVPGDWAWWARLVRWWLAWKLRGSRSTTWSPFACSAA